MKKRKTNQFKTIALSGGIATLATVSIYAASNYFYKVALKSKKHEKNNSMDNILKDEVLGHTDPKYYEHVNWWNSQGFRELTIESHDGLKLIGYHLEAKCDLKRIAILIHGYTGTAHQLAGATEFFHSENFHVFVPDNRGHGSSEGDIIGMGWLDKVDYLKWIDLTIEMYGEDVEILLYGVSMGGATVLMLSGEELPSNVKCIVEDCGYTSVKDIFSHQFKQMYNMPAFPLIHSTSLLSKIRAGYSFSEANTLKQVKKSITPTFFIHGENDTFVPIDMVYALHEVATCEKELWIVPNAKHGNSFYIAMEEYKTKVKNFYERYMIIE